MRVLRYLSRVAEQPAAGSTMPSAKARSWRRTAGALAPAVLALSMAALLWPALAHAENVWATTEEFSYGFLIVPVTLALIWWRRALLMRSLGQGATAAGLALILPALVTYLVAWRLGIHAVAGVAVSPLLLGVGVYMWGLAALWTFAARGSLAGRAAVILSTVPLVVFANSTRVALVLLVASQFGQDAALGFFHGASSLVLFGMSLSGLLVISRMVGCKPALSFA